MREPNFTSEDFIKAILFICAFTIVALLASFWFIDISEECNNEVNISLLNAKKWAKDMKIKNPVVNCIEISGVCYVRCAVMGDNLNNVVTIKCTKDNCGVKE